MTDTNNIKPDGDESMDDIGQLVRFAGARDSVDAERFENARARVAGHWEGVVANQRRQRNRVRFRQFGIAASLVMALGIALIVWQSPGGQHSMQLAYVDRVVGDVLIDGQAASSGDPLGTSSVIETMAGGRIAVSLANGQSMRVDNASRLLMDSADQLRLYSGGVYIDSGPAAADAHVAVITSHGVATDVGTQFQVRMERGHLRVAVREGLVELERPGNPVLEIDSGNLVDVSRTGDHSTVPVSGNDSLWSWVTSVSPVFDIEGATLEEYLGWYAREAGLALEWDSPASHHNAAQTRLSGSIRDMSLEEGFQLVRRIAPFDARVASSTLHVRVD